MFRIIRVSFDCFILREGIVKKSVMLAAWLMGGKSLDKTMLTPLFLSGSAFFCLDSLDKSVLLKSPFLDTVLIFLINTFSL